MQGEPVRQSNNIVDVHKNSVQQIEEDNYIKDSVTDDYEDDIADVAKKSATYSEINSAIQQDQASYSNSGALDLPKQN